MKVQSKRSRFAVVGLCAAVLVVAVAGIAAQGKKASLEEVLAAIGIVARNVDVITIQSSVWEEACIGIGVQCSSPHTHVPASSANHNPVAIRFQVLRNGRPVLGLTSATVFLESGSFPANGPGMQRCDEGVRCDTFGSDGDFQNGGNGLYVLWVHPHEPSGSLWQPGSYMMTMRVIDTDGLVGYGLADIEIAS